MFKVNNKKSKTTSMTNISYLSSVSIVDFEQINICWVWAVGSAFLKLPTKMFELLFQILFGRLL